MNLGTIFGIRILINPYFILLMLLYALAGILLQGILAFLVVLVHELAHIFSALFLGMRVTEVELLPFGGVARIDDFLEMNPRDEIRVAVAGPLSNLIMIVLAVLGYWLWQWQHPLVVFFGKINLMLFLFNLLPVLPLDGGRIYRALLLPKEGLKAATENAAGNGITVGIILGILGILGIVLGWTGLDFMLTVGFLIYASVRERGKAMYLFLRYVTRKKEELVRHGVLPVAEVVVADNVPLRSLIKYLIPQKFCLITILGKDLKLLGMVTEAEIIEGILSIGMDFPVGGLLHKQ